MAFANRPATADILWYCQVGEKKQGTSVQHTSRSCSTGARVTSHVSPEPASTFRGSSVLETRKRSKPSTCTMLKFVPGHPTLYTKPLSLLAVAVVPKRTPNPSHSTEHPRSKVTKTNPWRLALRFGSQTKHADLLCTVFY